MANRDSERGWYNYDIVGFTPPDVICRSCLDVITSPHQLSCCKHRVCYLCVESLLQNSQPCPLCGVEKFDINYDEEFDDTVLSTLRVKCFEEPEGCEWVGTIDGVTTHHNECAYKKLSCFLGCGEHILMRDIDNHETNECSKRPYTCEYCGHLETYDVITTQHWSTCNHYPIECPNNCGSSRIQRSQLQHHLDNECPIQESPCPYAYAGCDDIIHRGDMNRHIQDNAVHHVTIVTEMYKRIITEKDGILVELQRQVECLENEREVKDREILVLREELRALSENLQNKTEFYERVLHQQQSMLPELVIQRFNQLELSGSVP